MKNFKQFINEKESGDEKSPLDIAKGEEKFGSNLSTKENPNLKMQKISKDDQKIIEDLLGKCERAENIMSDIREFLREYSKISYKPVEDIITAIQSFKEALNK